MTTNQIHILISGSIATVSEILGKVAEAPPALQAQIPQMFPEQIRGYVAIGWQTLAGVAFIYALLFAHNKSAPTAPASLGQPGKPV